MSKKEVMLYVTWFLLSLWYGDIISMGSAIPVQKNVPTVTTIPNKNIYNIQLSQLIFSEFFVSSHLDRRD